jgi:hypothetical protein
MPVPVIVEPANNRELAISFTYDPILVEKIKNLPQRRWDKEKRRWTFMPSQENIEFIQKWFPHAKWDPRCATFQKEAKDRWDQRKEISRKKAEGDIDISALDKVKFKMPPLAHQKIALLLGRDMEVFAYLMDQGTGKTKVLLDDAAHNFRKGRINGLLVIAPNSVKTNWIDPDGGRGEVDIHMPPDVKYNGGCWVTGQTRAQLALFSDFNSNQNTKGVLDILIVNVEGIAFDRCFNYIENFCKKHKTMIVVDESTRIKHRSSQRSKAAMKLRKHSVIRRIASGTPVIKSPLNAFSQFNFLDPEVLGFSNYRAFESRYGVKGGFEGRQILFYQNLEELQERIDSCSYRVLKDDCLDLPPKLYQRRSVPLNAKQANAYRQMADEAIIAYEEAAANGQANIKFIEAQIVLTKYLRLQQITSGFLPILDEAGQSTGYIPLADVPPKIEEAINIIDECQGKVIVWARFRAEIEMMAKALKKAGISFVEFHGGISEAQSVTNRNAFQSDSEQPKVLLGTQSKGGIGITLNKARTVIYLSNTFDTEQRVQSEDRAHRIGTDGAVNYIDLIAPGTVDGSIIVCLRQNKKIADQIMKDGIRPWI